jgi:uncharacterized membrane protein YbaN (DUF454 family)
MNEKQAAAEATIVDQTNLLPKRQLLIVFGVLAISLFICFVDQNGIGVILPSLGPAHRLLLRIQFFRFSSDDCQICLVSNLYSDISAC